MNVDVDIVTADRNHVLAISTDAIRREESRPYVYVVRDGRTVKTTIETGAANDTQTIVRSGLAAGEVVVAEHNAAIVEGVAVKAAPSPSPGPSTGAGTS
jgi:membrane fusion protein (multidrug efflux system)